jgi:hypothetical protein
MPDNKPTILDTAVEEGSQNIKVNKDGTISPIDPTKPSKYSTSKDLKFEPTDTSEKGIIRAILLNMEWCHAVKTESLEKTVQSITTYLQQEVGKARLDEIEGFLDIWHNNDSFGTSDFHKRIATIRERSK